MVLSGELTPQAIEDTIEHFCRVNQVGRDAFEAHCVEARAEWTQLSKLEWTVDWGAFAALVTAAYEKRRAKLERLEEEWAEDHEDQALYEWPYFHSGEPL
jgi:hypothetical protein